MKNVLILTLFCFVALQINAQKIIEKEVNTSAKEVKVEFKFAEDIKAGEIAFLVVTGDALDLVFNGDGTLQILPDQPRCGR